MSQKTPQGTIRRLRYDKWVRDAMAALRGLNITPHIVTPAVLHDAFDSGVTASDFAIEYARDHRSE